MAKVAAIFPGQGSQVVGMGQDIAARWPAAARVFEAVDGGLGVALTRLCWEGPEEDLRLTENTQPALLAHSAAAWAVLVEHGVTVEAVAGHSLGEYSAAVAAGGLGVVEAARTVRLRGRLMQEAVPLGEGAMAAVIGLEDEVVVQACAAVTAELGQPVVAVNFNSPAQVVVAGAAAAVEAAARRCSELGAKRVMPLPVSAPFHSPLMAPARVGLTPALQALDLRDLAVPLYRNVDAAPVTAAAAVRDGLTRQVDSPVLWAESVRRMLADGFDTFVEVGAGRVLSGLVKRISRDAVCLSAGTVESITETVAALAPHSRA